MHNNEGKGKLALFSFTCTPQQFIFFYLIFISVFPPRHRPYIDHTFTLYRPHIDSTSISLHLHFLLLISIVFPPPPPSHFYSFISSCSSSSILNSFLLIFFFSQTGDLEGQAGQTQAKKANLGPK